MPIVTAGSPRAAKHLFGMSDKKCYIFDITLSQALYPDQHAVAAALRPWCKKFVFQLERGEKTGFMHYQCRVSLIKRMTMTTVANRVKSKDLPQGDWSITSKTEASKPQFSYVMKAETKVDGPWTDQDLQEPKQKTRQLLNFEGYDKYPWQLKVIELCQSYNERTITVILDRHGANGKSILCEHLEYHDIAMSLPAMRSMEDLMQCVYGQKKAKAYLVDMPRGMKKDKLAEFYSGLECIKNGYCYDKRYAFKKQWFDRPQILVFTNHLPKFDLLSMDRWVIYEIMQDYTIEGPRDCKTYITGRDYYLNEKKRKTPEPEYFSDLDGI